jgi:hypothetical protein
MLGPRLRGAGGGFAAIDDASGDDRGHGRAAKLAVIERGVAGTAGGFGGAECPRVIGGENCEVGGLAYGDFSFDAEDAGWTGGE